MGKDIPGRGSGFASKDMETEKQTPKKTVLAEAQIVWKACFGKSLKREVGKSSMTGVNPTTIGRREFLQDFEQEVIHSEF